MIKLSIDSGRQCLDWKDGSTDIAQTYAVSVRTSKARVRVDNHSFYASAWMVTAIKTGSKLMIKTCPLRTLPDCPNSHNV